MRRSSFFAIIAILLSGCAGKQPDRVYVDVDAILASERAPDLKISPLPQPKAPSPPSVVKQQGLPATSTTDRTLERLEAARRLIAENRGRSIASLSAMLKRVYLAQANDEIEKRRKDVQPEHDTILAAALERLREAFIAYGRERGPYLARLNVLVRNTDLEDQTVPENADPVAKANILAANKVRVDIRALDARYDKEASRLLAEAQGEIESEIAAIQAEADKTRAAAEHKALEEAESKANQTQVSLDVQVKQLVPGSLPAIPPRQVIVPGSAPMPALSKDTVQPIFGSLEQRRQLLDQEIDIWVRTTGHIRTKPGAKDSRDATTEFLQWRSAHKVGP
ncbi:MAG TPA: hypothetical protein VHE55_16075 [Fimbriimonadaceae bacterium]|nr:hypothetical protein [Fimbriimonadaceae bacterium]